MLKEKAEVRRHGLLNEIQASSLPKEGGCARAFGGRERPRPREVAAR
jgi:hypothetical protein